MDERTGIKRRNFLKLLGGIGCAAGLGGFTQVPFGFAKETYPSGKITYLVGYEPGGGIDMVARGVATFMEKHLKAVSPTPDKVGVMVKNRPGGGSIKALNDIYHAKPDGYTIAHGDDVLHTRSILGDLGFDIAEITFIARIASSAKVLVTNSKSSIYTWDDIVKASKKSPVKIGVGTFGTSNHVSTLLLTDTTGLAAKPIFFGGTAGTNAALLRGDVPLVLNSEDSLKNMIDIKELRAVLTFSEKSIYPGVQNARDIGFPELIEPIKSQRYVIAPPGLPADIKKILADALKKTMADKEFIAWNEKVGLSFDPVFGPELDALVKHIHAFYKSKENILRQYLVEKKS